MATLTPEVCAMPMNRVQFQAGLSMPEFLERYGTDALCEAALEAARWPRGFVCPNCGGAARTSFRRGRLRYWQCGACAHQCSLISGTIFESTKLALSRWFLALQLLTQSKNNVSALELMRQLGVCYRSAWLIKHKIMEAMRLREASRELDGRVEIDDAYLGGERSGGKAGRGSENKVPIVAAVQTSAEGQPVVACLRQQPHTLEEVAVFAAVHLAPSATVVSDGLWCFGAVKIVGAEQERVVTGGGKASVALPQFKAINTLLGNLKTAIGGTYHAFDFAKYAHRYLAEFQYRFNRRFNMRTLLVRLLHALVATPACPELHLRAAEVHR
jgi:ribosomal protein L37AE/L43A